jgi:hypothetical protein
VGRYVVAVTNDCGTTLSAAAELTVGDHPVITQQPGSQAVCLGDALTLEVVAVGRPPLTYAWRRNGQPIAGATGAQYTAASVTAGDAGEYTVVVTSGCGDLTSRAATVAVHGPAAIAQQPTGGQFCAGAQAALHVVPDGAPPFTFVWRKDGELIASATTDTLTLPNLTPASAGEYGVTVHNGCGGVDSTPAHVVVDAGPVITAPPQSRGVCAGEPVTFAVDVTSLASVQYQWQFNNQDIGGANAATYVLPAATADNAGEYRVVLTSSCGQLTSAPATLTVGAGPLIVTQPAPVAVCQGAAAELRVVASGGGNLTYQWRRGGLELPGEDQPTLAFAAASPADAGEYDVLVHSGCGTTPSSPATLVVNSGPAFVEAPHAQQTCAGAQVQFSASATGTPPLSYQWFKDGVALPDADSATLTIAAAGATDPAQYSIRVTNGCGEIVSPPVTLVVGRPPTLRNGPSAATVCAGTAIELTATADGGGLTYAWYKDNQPIAGATAATLRIAAAAVTDAGQYKIRATNSCGNVESGAVPLTVQTCVAPPTPPADPTPADGATGIATTTTLSWSADDADLGFDVYLGAEDPPALLGTSAAKSWTARNLTAGTHYTWQVVARNSAGATPGPRWSFDTAPSSGGGGNPDPGDTNEPLPDPNDSGRPDPNTTEPNTPSDGQPDVTCGGGGCGVGAVGAVPLTFLWLCGAKRRGRRGRVTRE